MQSLGLCISLLGSRLIESTNSTRARPVRSVELDEQAAAEHRPDRIGEPAAIVPGDVGLPEVPGDDLAALRHLTDRQRLLVLGAVACQHRVGGVAFVGDDDIDRAVDGAAIQATASAAVNPLMPRPSVSRFVTRMIGPSTSRSRSATPCTSSVGIRLVKKLPGPMIAASKVAIAFCTAGWMRACGSSQTRVTRWPRAWPSSTSTSPRVTVPSAYSAQSVARSTLTGQTRPRHPSSAAEAVHRGQEVAAVLLHHRQQQVAAGVAAEPLVLQRRQPAEQDAPRLALVARQRERAAQHVARRQHAKLIAELAGAAARIEHGHDRVDVQPRVALQAAEQRRQSPFRRRNIRR